MDTYKYYTLPLDATLSVRRMFEDKQNEAKRFTRIDVQTMVVDYNGWPVLMLKRGAVYYNFGTHNGHTQRPMHSLFPVIPGSWPSHQYGQDRPNKFSLGAMTKEKVWAWMDYCDREHSKAQGAFNQRELKRGEARGLYDTLRADQKWEQGREFHLTKGSHTKLVIDMDTAHVSIRLSASSGEALLIWNLIPLKE